MRVRVDHAHVVRSKCPMRVPVEQTRKGKSLLWPLASQWRIYYHKMWVQLSTTYSNVLKQTNGELLVAVNHNQLLTMAS